MISIHDKNSNQKKIIPLYSCDTSQKKICYCTLKEICTSHKKEGNSIVRDFRTFHQEYRFSITCRTWFFFSLNFFSCYSFLLFVCLIKKKCTYFNNNKKSKEWERRIRTMKTVIYCILKHYFWDDVCFWKPHWMKSVYKNNDEVNV